MTMITKFLTEKPVLRYYDVNRPVTIQCDVTQSRLGAGLLQDGQPISFVMRFVPFQTPKSALLKLKKKCWPLFSLTKSETDHEPLKSVFKTGDSQKCKVEAQYRIAPFTHIADALRRTYLKTTEGAQTELYEIRTLENVDHILRTHTSRPPRRDEQVPEDPEIGELIEVFKQGWPEKKRCAPAIPSCYGECSELIESQGLVFRGK